MAHIEGRSRPVPDINQMVIIHRMFRAEFARAADLIIGATHRSAPYGNNAPTRDGRPIALVAAHLSLICRLLEHHHHSEDRLLWPLLHHRVPIDTDLIAAMKRQHADLAANLGTLAEQRLSWELDPTPATADAAATTARAANQNLVRHLDDEERRVLPLIERYITVEEWETLTRDGGKAMPRMPRAAAIAAWSVLRRCDGTEQHEFLAALPAPIRLFLLARGRRIADRHEGRLNALIR